MGAMALARNNINYLPRFLNKYDVYNVSLVLYELLQCYINIFNFICQEIVLIWH